MQFPLPKYLYSQRKLTCCIHVMKIKFRPLSRYPQSEKTIHFTKTTAMQNEVALSYCSVRGLYFLAVVFVSLKVRK